MANEDLETGSPDEPDWEALARYLAGESDPVERARIERTLAAEPAREALVRALGSAMRPADPAALSDADVEAALRSVMAQREPGPTVIPIESHTSRRRTAARRPLGWRAAAAVLLVASAALVWRFASIGAGSRPAQIAATGAAGRITTGVGIVDSVVLADGSRVILGPRSTLTILTDYGVSARTLELRGQGYFDVRHDPSRPFVVRTAAGDLTDVGTRFAVESADARDLRVVVLDGVVAVRPLRAALADTLRARDRGALSSDGVLLVERQAAGPEDAAWMSGRILLRDAPVSRVSAELARWYGLELRVTDSTLRNRRLTATFEHATPEDVAHVLAATLGGTARLAGDTLWITPLPSGPARP